MHAQRPDKGNCLPCRAFHTLLCCYVDWKPHIAVECAGSVLTTSVKALIVHSSNKLLQHIIQRKEKERKHCTFGINLMKS